MEKMKRNRWILTISLVLALSIQCLSQGYSPDQLAFTAKVKAYSLSYNFIDSHTLLKEMMQTSVKVLDQRGFRGVIFFKVKIRNRYGLEWYFFLNNITDIQKDKVFRSTIDTEYRDLRKQTMQRLSITDSTSNDYLEANLGFNYEKAKGNSHLTPYDDYYFIYLTNRETFILIRKNKEYFPLPDFFKRILATNNLDNIFELTYLLPAGNKVKSLPKEILDDVWVDELGVEWLKL